MNAFVLAETENGARELCAGARSIADNVELLTIGDAVTGIADTCLHLSIPDDAIADDAYPAINDAFDASDAKVVFAEPTIRITSLAGRLAAHAHTAAIAGVNGFDNGVATSMYFGGTGVKESKATTDVSVYLVSAGTFDGSKASGTDKVEEVAFKAPAKAAVKKSSSALPKSDIDLASADKIVACGRGFEKEEDLQLARDLASKIGADVACSRPLAEGVNWFPREAYIGVSGAFVKPDVYFAVGISGQMQHMVGCNDAKTIIAVNSDKNAPIFKDCDLGIIGDLKDVLPALTKAL